MPLLITTAEDESGKENAKEGRRKWNKTGEPMIESSNYRGTGQGKTIKMRFLKPKKTILPNKFVKKF